MQLMLLSDGGLSLEFAPADMDSVRDAMRELGDVARQDGPTHTIFTIAGGQLIHTDDWNDPCLIAGDDDGKRILRALFDRLVEKATAPRRAA